MRRTLVLAPVLLATTGCGTAGTTVGGYGIRLAVPAGWHARVYRGAVVASTARPTLAVPKLGADGVSATLLEEGRADTGPLSLYPHGAPRPFTPKDFSRLGGNGFGRRLFTVAGRYFDLEVQSGSPQPSPRRLAELNRVVRAVKIEPGNFYRGAAASARFRPARGWFVRSSRTIPAGPQDYSVTIAATISWQKLGDSPFAADVHAMQEYARSLARLRATHGIAIVILLMASNTSPPPALSRKVRLGTPRPYRIPEGPSFPGMGLYSGQAEVAHEYLIMFQVIYGTRHPTGAQQARARAELARLVLPRWPRWPS
jgi:hypothetical protein